MESVLAVFQYIAAHFSEIVAAAVGLFGALIVVFSLIPGDQPDRALQGIVDFLKKFSVK